LFVACGTSGSPAERLELRLTVTRQGISVIAFGAAMATDCRRHAGTVTFPRAADGTLDLAALTRCARQLKSARPEETQVLLQAERSIEYRELMEVLDAVRTDPTGELFPEVNLGVLPPQDGGVAP
jgi:hypothetical protein